MARKNSGLSFVSRKKVVSKDLVGEILSTIFFCFAAVLFGVVLVVAFGLRTSVIGSSMMPELNNGQEVLIDRFAFKMLNPSRYDVVCFYPKGNENSHMYIKRVIGLPSETIQIKDGYVYVDGIRLLDDEHEKIWEPGLAEAEFKLGEGEYFVLGDNRNNSEDSRNGNIGAVSKDTMVGKVWYKFSKDDNSFGFVE